MSAAVNNERGISGYGSVQQGIVLPSQLKVISEKAKKVLIGMGKGLVNGLWTGMRSSINLVLLVSTCLGLGMIAGSALGKVPPPGSYSNVGKIMAICCLVLLGFGAVIGMIKGGIEEYQGKDPWRGNLIATLLGKN